VKLSIWESPSKLFRLRKSAEPHSVFSPTRANLTFQVVGKKNDFVQGGSLMLKATPRERLSYWMPSVNSLSAEQIKASVPRQESKPQA
jgi:hypothetical protein